MKDLNFDEITSQEKLENFIGMLGTTEIQEIRMKVLSPNICFPVPHNIQTPFDATDN